MPLTPQTEIIIEIEKMIKGILTCSERIGSDEKYELQIIAHMLAKLQPTAYSLPTDDSPLIDNSQQAETSEIYQDVISDKYTKDQLYGKIWEFNAESLRRTIALLVTELYGDNDL